MYILTAVVLLIILFGFIVIAIISSINQLGILGLIIISVIYIPSFIKTKQICSFQFLNETVWDFKEFIHFIRNISYLSISSIVSIFLIPFLVAQKYNIEELSGLNKYMENEDFEMVIIRVTSLQDYNLSFSKADTLKEKAIFNWMDSCDKMVEGEEKDECFIDLFTMGITNRDTEYALIQRFSYNKSEFIKKLIYLEETKAKTRYKETEPFVGMASESIPYTSWGTPDNVNSNFGLTSFAWNYCEDGKQYWKYVQAFDEVIEIDEKRGGFDSCTY